jgi:tetratricopeptide (TPR) repeat protein
MKTRELAHSHHDPRQTTPGINKNRDTRLEKKVSEISRLLRDKTDITPPLLSLFSSKSSENISLKADTLMKLEQSQPELNENSLFLFLKGNLLTQLKQTKEAIACYKYSLQLSPNNILVHQKLAEIYSDVFQLNQAEHHLNLALALSSVQNAPSETEKALTELKEEIEICSMLNTDRFE